MSRAAALAATVLIVLAAAGGARACGDGGYTYAGVASEQRAFGIRAVVTPLTTWSISAGHIAGWVGVGGPHEGPNGTDEWLQVGYNSIGGLEGANLYYEVVRSGGAPSYHQIAANLSAGRPARVAVLEMRARPEWWRVWVDGSPASAPIHLQGSHGRWSPIATAESWDGDTGICNAFLYRFTGIAIAAAPGGSWSPLLHTRPIQTGLVQLRALRASASFVAAQGARALRTLATLSR